jgi:hypothetical protein
MRRFLYFALGLSAAWITLAPFHAAAQGVPITNQTKHALEFYGGRSAVNTLSQMPRRSAIQPASTGQLQHNGKPFQGTTTTPTVSPYLNLFRDERQNTEAVPAYYSFVRPQMEQQASAATQQREIEQLRRQVQGQPLRTTVVPGNGIQARYMDTAQFYGGWQR